MTFGEWEIPIDMSQAALYAKEPLRKSLLCQGATSVVPQMCKIERALAPEGIHRGELNLFRGSIS